MRFAGIDVSAKNVTIQFSEDGKLSDTVSFENTHKGHKKLIKFAKKAKQILRVCLEATGVYHLDLAVALAKVKGIEIMVINPKAARNFSKSLMQREKSDVSDTTALLIYAERMDFVPWEKPCNTYLNIRAYARRIASLTDQKAQAKNQLHALQETDLTPKVILRSQMKTIAFFEVEIERLKNLALNFINKQEELKKLLEKIVSVKGYAEASAIQLLGELLVLPKELNNKQWVAMAGLDPSRHESGTSVKKKARISKAGNRYLRKALFMPSLSAVQHEPHVKAYYTHLIEVRGLKKMQALCAVMRKFLHAFHGMFKNNQNFEGKRFFPAYQAIV